MGLVAVAGLDAYTQPNAGVRFAPADTTSRHGNCRSRFHYTDPLGFGPRATAPLYIPQHSNPTGHLKDDTPMPPINSDFYRLLCNSLVGLLFLTSTTVFAKAVPERADIDAEFKWDLTDMYADATAWEADQERF
ncbi:MAG: hypothetical protein CM15mP25_5970 [Gammaproteobacteria bacterium]|nr:MAG: hypothetical protein CM15mP25_5970 [Gammaproteobacteria bacterium]